MSESIYGIKRTKMCGEVAISEVEKNTTLMGWVQRRRDMGGIIFIDLRDRTGIVQIVINTETIKDFEKVQGIKNEYVLAVLGKVVKRSENTVNKKIRTGEVEVLAEEVRISSKCDILPFPIDDNSEVNENVRMKYRYLDLRRPNMQKNMIFRSKVANISRNYFAEQGFVEVETPIMTKSTPEGARDYLVPSRVHPGNFYALPQSPQLFKQLLMLAGYDRYMQIAKCFRDEDLRADRQPEFTQIDLEMSFVNVDDVIEIQEGFVKRLFHEVMGMELDAPFLRMAYKDAMEQYGSDKPDIRYDMKLVDLSDIFAGCEFKVFADAVANGGSVRVINANGCAGYTRKQVDELIEFVKIYRAKGLATFAIENGEYKSNILKFLKEDQITEIIKRTGAKEGDLILFVADTNKVVFDALGALRQEMAKRLGLINKDEFKFLWVTEFPLLEWDEEEKRFSAMHHPFTSPMDEDFELLDTDPAKVRAKAYDLVLNGTEVAGGSIRIHSQELQQKMFSLLGFSTEQAWERFGFLLEAFKYGVPPHGGMAYGLDRLVMLMLGEDSIREVIAFPKDKSATCPMTDAPSAVDNKQLKELKIKLDIDK